MQIRVFEGTIDAHRPPASIVGAVYSDRPVRRELGLHYLSGQDACAAQRKAKDEVQAGQHCQQQEGPASCKHLGSYHVSRNA